MDIMAGLAAANVALSTVKAIQEIDKGINEAEYKLKIAELYTTLADVKIALSDAETEQRELHVVIKELQSAANFEKSLIEYKGFQYDLGDDGKPVGPPYCPVCITNEKKFFRIYRGGADNTCPNCRKKVGRATIFLFPEERK